VSRSNPAKSSNGQLKRFPTRGSRTERSRTSPTSVSPSSSFRIPTTSTSSSPRPWNRVNRRVRVRIPSAHACLTGRNDPRAPSVAPVSRRMPAVRGAGPGRSPVTGAASHRAPPGHRLPALHHRVPRCLPSRSPRVRPGSGADLQIPAQLRDQIETGHGQFTGNFLRLGDRPVDQPVWAGGFDEMAWLDRGHDLAERLGEHYPEHFVFCCAEKYVVCEIAADQLGYVCALTGLHKRQAGWRMPGNEPDPDVPAAMRLMPEYGVEWGIWAGKLPYHQTPRLRSSSGPVGFATPRSLGLTAELEERLRRWNDDWRRGFVDYGSGPE